MADAKMLKKVPVREQDPKVRATNFEEVCLGYNQEEAMEEAPVSYTNLRKAQYAGRRYHRISAQGISYR